MISDRIRRARLLRGLSLQALAEQMDNISKQMLSKFEQGSAVPNSARLLELARVLSVKPEYFFRSDSVQIAPLEFRKRTNVPQWRQDRIGEQVRDQLERYVSIESVLELSADDAACSSRQSLPVDSLDDVESAADQLRADWNIGGDEIGHLVQLLEDHGLKVALFDDEDGVDAACAVTDDGSNVLIALNRHRSGDRQRFNAAHELGHWVLRFPESLPLKHVEHWCHRFAGAFLYPRARVMADFGAHRRLQVHVRELALAKRRYGVSMGAILHRLKDLDLITDAGYRAMQIHFSRQGWRKAEPEPIALEEPQRFEGLVYRALGEDLISASRAAELLQQSITDLDAFMVAASA